MKPVSREVGGEHMVAAPGWRAAQCPKVRYPGLYGVCDNLLGQPFPQNYMGLNNINLIATCSPIVAKFSKNTTKLLKKMVSPTGFEAVTSAFGDRRYQLRDLYKV